jgi:predicted AAA+ superfamily ATPase
LIFAKERAIITGMRRFSLEKLVEWKARPGHKPMIIQGVRQVGKTWLMKEFGRLHYQKIAYIWFEKNARMRELFSGDMDVRRILTGLEIETGIKIEPDNTLIIFDEIQECPNALTALKYFNEEAGEYDIIAAGSLLGITLHSGISFPVGKVEFMKLYPLSFKEFLLAVNEDKLYELIISLDWKLIEVFSDKLINFLKMYYYIGGMPEVVSQFSKERDFNTARKIQNDILESYQNDFSKHIPVNNLQKVRQLWDSVPAQLSKENKKFIFKDVMKNAASSTFEIPLGWLENCGLVHKINRVSKPAQPLKGYEKPEAFKLFLCDIGLLSALVSLEAKVILEGDALFTEFKGALTEQYTCQELKLLDNIEIAYWVNDSATAEIDFILQLKNRIIPLEVKSSTNLKAKSLSVYRQKFQPETEIRTSLAKYNRGNNLIDIPLYALGGLAAVLG